ncbi:Methyltransferase domain-containing protein [Micromonospora citrea]|uniref:Methyltransferase domain-containing protein n=1 Tax=Micromonospora citrea TaxID=47855 RepID=A0A1C6VZ28_9ACTN|nr:class I SAM-dependent methyltransferase [Micromonospora citrea]SCL71160.1 Methyltransferase domain-containing protein [Micromonospora citrea]
MPDGWQWDPTLFQGSAAYYERGRLPYAPRFAERLAEELALDGSGRLLDVGCGPGTATLALAPYFVAVVGVDPDPDMLVEAGRRARRLDVGNARWVAARAEELPAGLGEFRAVMFAQSFHWTDRDEVAAVVRGMLPPGGAFLHMSDRKGPPTEPAGLPHPAPPSGPVAALVRSYLGEVRRAGRGVLVDGTPGGEEHVLARAGFEGFRRLIVPAGAVVERSADDVVANVFSRSDSAPHLFGDRLGAFERDLRLLLRETSPGGVFAERVPDTEIKIWRRPVAARRRRGRRPSS